MTNRVRLPEEEACAIASSIPKPMKVVVYEMNESAMEHRFKEVFSEALGGGRSLQVIS